MDETVNFLYLLELTDFLIKEEKRMTDFEVFLRKAREQKTDNSSINFLPINSEDRAIIEKLEKDGLIKNARYIGMKAVGFDLTYDGLHYFD